MWRPWETPTQTSSSIHSSVPPVAESGQSGQDPSPQSDRPVILPSYPQWGQPPNWNLGWGVPPTWIPHAPPQHTLSHQPMPHHLHQPTLYLPLQAMPHHLHHPMPHLPHQLMHHLPHPPMPRHQPLPQQPHHPYRPLPHHSHQPLPHQPMPQQPQTIPAVPPPSRDREPSQTQSSSRVSYSSSQSKEYPEKGVSPRHVTREIKKKKPAYMRIASPSPDQPTSTARMYRRDQEQRVDESSSDIETPEESYVSLVESSDEEESRHKRKRRAEKKEFWAKRRKRFGSPSYWPDFEPRDHFILEELEVEESENLPVMQRRFRVNIRNLNIHTRLYDEIAVKLSNIFEAGLDQMLQTERPNRWGRLVALNDGLYTRGFGTPFVPLSELDMERVLDGILAALNSDENVDLTKTKFELVSIPDPTPSTPVKKARLRRTKKKGYLRRTTKKGSKRYGKWVPGVKGRNILDISHWLKKRLFVHNPSKLLFGRKAQKEFEHMCAPLAIVDGVYLASNPGLNQVELRRWYRSKVRKNLTKSLAFKVCEDKEEAKGPFSQEQIVQMAEEMNKELPHTRFSIFLAPVQPCHVIESEEAATCFVDLLLYEGHVYVIRKLHVFLGGETVCRGCHNPVHKTRGHVCSAAQCTSCFNPNCLNDMDLENKPCRETCHVCLARWKSRACLTAHTRLGKCKERKRCDDCLQLFNTSTEHSCSPPVCQKCGLEKPAHHRCWVWPNETDKKAGDAFKSAQEQDGDQEDEEDVQDLDKFFTADFECEPGEDGRHVPILFTLYRLKDEEEEVIEYVGLDCADQFIRDIVETDKFKGATIGMHNGSRYDSILLLKSFLERQLKIEVLPRGNQILCLKYKPKKLRFLDTYLHMPLPLRSLPKAFDVQEAGEKGHFPYLLNVTRYMEGQGECPDGQHYEEYGLSPLQLFDPDFMKPKDAKELERWWLETNREMRQRQERYQVVESLRRYCLGDCRILYHCLCKYIDQIKKEFPGISVLGSLTSTSFSNRLYRAFFGEEKTIAVIEPERYGQENHSYIALAWLFVQKLNHKLDWLRDARHGGEVSLLLNRGVDGYGGRRERNGDGTNGGDETHIAFQFYGCHCHGCPKCEEASEEQREAYEDTMNASRRLKALGANPNSIHGQFQVVEVWECDFMRERRENPELDALVKRYLKTLSRVPLSPRHALYGVPGMSMDIKLAFEVTSLYPWCQAYCRLPIGHPEIYISSPELEQGPSLEDAFGLVSARVLAPRHPNIHIPILPFRTGGRLLFPLCGTCATEATTKDGAKPECSHTDKEREMDGVWTTIELNEAIKSGYQLVQIRELWHWKSSSSTLFRNFIAKLFARKYEASGWPEHVVTEEDKEREVANLRDLYGIHIDPANVSPNSAARNVAKIHLNSGWGFLARKTNGIQTSFITNMDELYDIICDNNVTLKDMQLVGDLIMVQHQDIRERPSRTGNVPLGCFITAWARLRLLNFMRSLPDPTRSLCYVDTDSMIYFVPEGEKGPDYDRGGALGEMKDELDGGVGKLFCAAGAKSYRLAYVTPEGERKEIIRAKGLNLSSIAVTVLTPDVIRDVADKPGHSLPIPQRQFKRTAFSRDSQIRSVTMEKRFKFSDIKRIRIPETGTTHPLGFVP